MNYSDLPDSKKVLITGGAGFIGSYIVEELLKQNCIIYIIDNLSTGLLSNIPRDPKIHFYQGSVLDENFLSSFKNISFNVIFHLASVVGMRLATHCHSLTYNTITTGTKNVLTTFENIPIVLFSSSSVYGFTSNQSVNEKNNASFGHLLGFDGGECGYGCGKWKMEEIGLQEASKGRKVLIIRPFNIVGHLQLSDYGMVVPNFIKSAIAGGPIKIFNNGEQIRSFSDVKTFIYCLFTIMQFDSAWKINKNIFNIGSKAACSINKLASIVLQETKSTSRIEYISYSKIFPDHKDVQYRVPDTTHGEQYYGIIQWPSVKDNVKEILRSMKVNQFKEINLQY